MSAIAQAYLVETHKLQLYLGPSGSWDELIEDSVPLTYRWSGHVLATLLPYLDSQGVALIDSLHSRALSNKREATCFIFTPEHRVFLDRLDPLGYSGKELREYYGTFNETDADGVEAPMLDGIQFLADMLGRVREGSVALLEIG